MKLLVKISSLPKKRFPTSDLTADLSIKTLSKDSRVVHTVYKFQCAKQFCFESHSMKRKILAFFLFKNISLVAKKKKKDLSMHRFLTFQVTFFFLIACMNNFGKFYKLPISHSIIPLLLPENMKNFLL